MQRRQGFDVSSIRPELMALGIQTPHFEGVATKRRAPRLARDIEFIAVPLGKLGTLSLSKRTINPEPLGLSLGREQDMTLPLR